MGGHHFVHGDVKKTFNDEPSPGGQTQADSRDLSGLSSGQYLGQTFGIDGHHHPTGSLSEQGPMVGDPERLTEVLAIAETAEVPTVRLGLATGSRFIVKGLLDVTVDEVVAAYTGRLPEALGVGTINR